MFESPRGVGVECVEVGAPPLVVTHDRIRITDSSVPFDSHPP